MAGATESSPAALEGSIGLPTLAGSLVPIEPPVGRGPDLAELRALLEEDAAVVTVTGPPGIGKTRLVRELLREHEGAIAWCHLGGVRSPVDVHGRLVRSFGGPPDAIRSVERVVEFVGRRANDEAVAVLVLDEVDHAEEGLGDLIQQVLRRAAGLRIVTTALRSLGLPGETRLPLGPLDAPSTAALLESRLRRVGGIRAMRQASAEDVDELIARLGGHPLTIELVASRLLTLGVRRMLRRWDERFVLLEDCRTAQPSRHSSIALALRQAWDPLSRLERRLVVAGSLVRDPLPIEWIERFVEPDAGAAEILDAAESLVDRGLADASEGQFLILPWLRSFGAEEAEREGWLDGVVETVAIAHTEALRARAPSERGAPVKRGLAFLERAWPDLRDLILRCLGTQPATGLELVRALLPFIPYAGPLDFEAVLEQAARVAATLGHRDLEAEVAVERAIVASHWEADESAAFRLLENHGDAIASCGSGELHARVDRIHAMSDSIRASREGDADAVLRCAAALEAVSERPISLAHRVTPLLTAATYVIERNPSHARRLVERALELLGDRPLLHHQGTARLLLGCIDLNEAEPRSALPHLRLARGMLSDHGFRRNQDDCDVVLGIALYESGREREAVSQFDETLARLRRTPARTLVSALAYAGAYAHEWGDMRRAQALLQEAAHVASYQPRSQTTPFWMAHLALVEGRLGRPAKAESWIAQLLEWDRAGTLGPFGPACVLLGRMAEVELARWRDEDVGERLDQLGDANAKLPLPNVEHRAAQRLVDALLHHRDVVRRPTLEVARDGSWFRIEHGQPVLMGRKPVLRAILQALVEARVRWPEHCELGASELIDVAWGGERLDPRSATNRLYVSMRSLRQLGLEGWLLTTPEGYALGPGMAVDVHSGEPRPG